jgi:formate dehydrogenase major subunit
LEAAAAGLGANRGAAYGMFSCSKATNEVNYLAQKFSRVVMGSNNIDSCNRT